MKLELQNCASPNSVEHETDIAKNFFTTHLSTLKNNLHCGVSARESQQCPSSETSPFINHGSCGRRSERIDPVCCVFAGDSSRKNGKDRLGDNTSEWLKRKFNLSRTTVEKLHRERATSRSEVARQRNGDQSALLANVSILFRENSTSPLRVPRSPGGRNQAPWPIPQTKNACSPRAIR